jgi:hypothetical protein
MEIVWSRRLSAQVSVTRVYYSDTIEAMNTVCLSPLWLFFHLSFARKLYHYLSAQEINHSALSDVGAASVAAEQEHSLATRAPSLNLASQ